ncbi:DUF6600 domain-containing protein [Granulicella cerasi]|uniref:DUF6600 domain-containing protein n=1 Tax=Granulicella cerasi TaxID=741063 RepID=A0ABW1ZC79_9BACT|nr:DUF6600 domain-containing protein [Granulicella cerasi]
MKTFSRHRVLWFAPAVAAAGLMFGGAYLLSAQDPSGAYAQMTPDQQQQADFQAGTGDPSADPPQRVARVAVLNGQASFQPAAGNGFVSAELNYPLTGGDRLYTADNSQAEVQTGQIAVRLGANTDFTVQAMTDTLAQFGLAGGSVHLRTFGYDVGSQTEVDTPNVAVSVQAAGDIRIDVDPSQDITWVNVLSGQARIEGNNFTQVVNSGTALQLAGTDNLEVQQVHAQQADVLDQFSISRDQQFQQAEQEVGGYVDEGTIGSEDLAANGSWQQDSEYGPVWYPAGVAVDWEPYRVGHWAFVPPWGWTWVGGERWGFAPYHYGRWARFGPRWGWIPGPRGVRPVYAPALVVFVGGSNFTGWFPLGPREVFTPWYRTSGIYINRVNVTNIWSRDPAMVRRVYDMRTPYSGFAGGNAGRNFAYRGRAVAMAPGAFAAGRPVAGNRMQLGQQQLAGAAVVGRPQVQPGPRMYGGGAPNGGARQPQQQQGGGFFRGPSQSNRPGSAGYNRGGNGGQMQRGGPQQGGQPPQQGGYVGRPGGNQPGQNNGGNWNRGGGQPSGGQPQQPATSNGGGNSRPQGYMPTPQPGRRIDSAPGNGGNVTQPSGDVRSGAHMSPGDSQNAPTMRSAPPNQQQPTGRTQDPNPRRNFGPVEGGEPQQRQQPQQHQPDRQQMQRMYQPQPQAQQPQRQAQPQAPPQRQQPVQPQRQAPPAPRKDDKK